MIYSTNNQAGSGSSGARSGAYLNTYVGPIDPDRTVHASMTIEGDERLALRLDLVRYDKQGRWYVETFNTAERLDRERIKTVHDAAERALAFEAQGGTIYEKRPGGTQFDSKVAGGRRKRQA